MKRNFTLIVFLVILMTVSINIISCGKSSKQVTLTSEKLTISGDKMTAVFPHDTESFSFLEDITVSDDAHWVISTDIYGMNTVITKTVPLNYGDNTFYIHVSNSDQSVSTYTVNLYRKHIYTVKFNTNGGSSVADQNVQEGEIINAPDTVRDGYVLDSWDYDFNTPITSNVTANATWHPKSDTKYIIEYYLENIDKNGYSEPEVVELYATTDSEVNIIDKTYEHFTLDTSKSTLSGIVSGDGSLVLKAYYNRKLYAVYAESHMNTVVDDINCDHAHLTLPSSLECYYTEGDGNYSYGTCVTLTAIIKNDAFTFLGWYDGDVKVCNDETFCFTVEKDVSYVAKWEPNENTKHIIRYYFNSQSSDEYKELELTGIISKEDIIKNIEHYTLECAYLSTSGEDGTLYYILNYQKNTYTISTWIEYLSSSNASARIVGGYTCGPGEIIYATTEPQIIEKEYSTSVTLIASSDEGYIFLGWYDENGVQAAETESYSFFVTGNVSYIARYAPNTDI